MRLDHLLSKELIALVWSPCVVVVWVPDLPGVVLVGPFSYPNVVRGVLLGGTSIDHVGHV